MRISVREHHEATHGTGDRESVALLLKVFNEHTPGVLEDLNRVAHLATDLAKRLGLSSAETERVELAARLHDIGKVAIHQSILHKDGPLDDQEWVIMRTHAEIGERIVRSSPSLAHIADLVRSHHERFDGTGYPDRLAGEAIAPGASIISICAAFVAMMRHRPYSDAITVAEALGEIRRHAGTQFNPKIAAVFDELLADESLGPIGRYW